MAAASCCISSASCGRAATACSERSPAASGAAHDAGSGRNGTDGHRRPDRDRGGSPVRRRDAARHPRQPCAMDGLVNDLGRDWVRRLVGLLAGVGGVLVLVVIVSSAYLRLSDAGLSCSDWPACYGAMHHAAEATSGERAARLAHRFTATGVTAVLIALLTVALRQRP